MDAVFTTERLRARAFRLDDAEAAYRIYRDPEMVRWLGNPRPHTSLDDTRRWLAGIAAWVDGLPPGLGFWALELRETGELVGAALCAPLPGGEGEVEIGWHVAPGHQGEGLATDAGRALLGHARKLRLDRVYAVVHPGNAASLRVAEKLDMRRLGRTTRYYEGEMELYELELSPSPASTSSAERLGSGTGSGP